MGWQDAPVVGGSWQDAPLVEEKPKNKMLDMALKVAPWGLGGYYTDAAMGVRQAVDATAQAAARATGLGVKQTETANQEAKSFYDLTKPEERPGSSLVRGVLPALGAARVMPSSSSVLANTLMGAGVGGVGSVLEPVYGSPSDDEFWAKKRQQLGQGVVAGGATSGALGVASKVISPALGPLQQLLAQEGIRMTPGQAGGGIAKAMEDRIAGMPIIGDLVQGARRSGVEDFNRALYVRALAPFGKEGLTAAKNAPVGRDGIAEVGDFLSSKYQDALSKAVPSVVDNQFRSGIGKLHSMVPDALQADFDKALTNALHLTPMGTVTGTAAKEADSALKTMARQYKGSSLASEQQMGAALDQAAAEVRSMMRRYNTGEVANALTAADKGWATLAQIERAGASTATNGVITPAQFLNSGVKRGDGSVRDRKFARGEMSNQDLAEAAKDVLPSKVPDSGTGGRNALLAAISAGPAGLAHLVGGPAGAMATGAAMLPYMPVIGPAINAARISASSRSLAELLRRMAPAGGLLGVYGAGS
jgi:hypothetical protein